MTHFVCKNSSNEHGETGRIYFLPINESVIPRKTCNDQLHETIILHFSILFLIPSIKFFKIKPILVILWASSMIKHSRVLRSWSLAKNCKKSFQSRKIYCINASHSKKTVFSWFQWCSTNICSNVVFPTCLAPIKNNIVSIFAYCSSILSMYFCLLIILSDTAKNTVYSKIFKKQGFFTKIF